MIQTLQAMMDNATDSFDAETDSITLNHPKTYTTNELEELVQELLENEVDESVSKDYERELFLRYCRRG